MLGVTVCVGVGTFVQSSIGFGLNLLLTPFALLLFPGFVPVPAFIANGLLSLVVVVRELHAVSPAIVRLIGVASLPGSVAGVALLTVIEGRLLGLMAAGCVLVAVVLSAFRVGVRSSSPAIALGGVFAGFLAATTSITGPPVALVMRGRDPVVGRTTVAATGVVVTITAVAALVVLRPVAFAASAPLTVYMIPGMLVGLVLSRVVGHRVSHRVQSIGTLVVSGGAAVVLILHSTFFLVVSSGA